MVRGRGRWCLPAAPPEAWLSQAWPSGLGLALVVAALGPWLALPPGSPVAVVLGHALGAAGAVLGAYGLVVRRLVTGRSWLAAPAAGLALVAVAHMVGAVLTTDPAAGGTGPRLAVGAALALVGLGLARPAARYHGQVRQWRRLESAARSLRSRTALMPGRSITPEDHEGLPDAAAVERLLTGRVGMALQPVLDLRTGQVVGREALSRFGGREPTDRWFRAAAVHGLGAALERRTLATALALLDRDGDDPHEWLAVNVSPVALEDPAVLRLLLARDLRRVVVEVTEHDPVPDHARLRATIRRLRSRGARIALDDTGAGFASLRQVLLVQPDLVKLDTVLTRAVGDPRYAALVTELVAFAAAVGLELLAEGVESEVQATELRGLGVRLGQGWHLGVPFTVVPPPDRPDGGDPRSRAS